MLYCSINKIHQYRSSLSGKIFKCCACASCTIQYAIRENNDRKHRTSNTPQNESRQPRIRNRMPTRPTRRISKTNTLNSHTVLKRTHDNTRTTAATATSRNMQRTHTRPMARRLLLYSARTGRRPQRNGTKRLPLRQNRSRPRTSRPDERRNPDKRRKTTALPLCPKKTTQKLERFRRIFGVLSIW